MPRRSGPASSASAPARPVPETAGVSMLGADRALPVVDVELLHVLRHAASFHLWHDHVDVEPLALAGDRWPKASIARSSCELLDDILRHRSPLRLVAVRGANGQRARGRPARASRPGRRRPGCPCSSPGRPPGCECARHRPRGRSAAVAVVPRQSIVDPEIGQPMRVADAGASRRARAPRAAPGASRESESSLVWS